MDGAGGANNSANFAEAIRKSDQALSSIKLSNLLTAEEYSELKEWADSLTPASKARDFVFQTRAIHPIAAACIHKFGIQPATSMVGIYDHLGLELQKLIHPSKLQKPGNYGAKIATRASGFKRGGSKGKQMEVVMTKEYLEASSPMRFLEKAGKVHRVSPSVDGFKRKRRRRCVAQASLYTFMLVRGSDPSLGSSNTCMYLTLPYLHHMHCGEWQCK